MHAFELVVLSKTTFKSNGISLTKNPKQIKTPLKSKINYKRAKARKLLTEKSLGERERQEEKSRAT